MFRGMARVILLAAGLRIVCPVLPAADLEIDQPMHRNPQLGKVIWRKTFSERLKPLWRQALERPEAELRRVGADTVAIAVQRGMSGLEEMEQPLLAILESDQDPVVRRAAAHALIAIDARGTASRLYSAAQSDGMALALIVEPALARWKYPEIQESWLGRLQQEDAEKNMLLLAIEGLGSVGEPRAVDRLITLLDDRLRSPEIRLAAARALGQIATRQLADETSPTPFGASIAETAKRLIARQERPECVGRLLAANLLPTARDPATLKTLRSLAVDSESTVALASLEKLRNIDSTLALPFVATATKSADANLRRLAAELLTGKGDADAVQQLTAFLDDRNPAVRRLVAAKFVEFGSRPELRQVVIDQSMQWLQAPLPPSSGPERKGLSSNAWRGTEQAIMVLGSLDHEPAVWRMMRLLDHPRPETAVAAAWGLRKLHVPDALPELLVRAEGLRRQLDSAPPPRQVSEQLLQIVQYFGEVNYREAEPFLRRFVPSSLSLDYRVRAAAIWALGLMYANQPDTDLAAMFAARLADVPPPGDRPLVRRFAAISLGRMKVVNQLDTLRRFAAQEGPSTEIGIGVRWALREITGEEQEPVPSADLGISGWFLVPIDSESTDVGGTP
jgi:HEAT repeat protein